LGEGNDRERDREKYLEERPRRGRAQREEKNTLRQSPDSSGMILLLTGVIEPTIKL